MTDFKKFGKSLNCTMWNSLGPSFWCLSVLQYRPSLIKPPWNVFESLLNQTLVGLMRYAVNDYLGDMRA